MISPETFASFSEPTKFRARWQLTARENQRTPEGEWNVWLLLAGRGFGKTRSGAEDVAAWGLDQAGSRIAIVAPTYADARDTCVEGESGMLAVLPPTVVETWNRSLGELVLTNGTRYKLFSADEPNRLRGPQHHRAWADELAAWSRPETWDQLTFGLRLGDRPQTVVTTTPRPTPLIRALRQRADVVVTTGSTFDNAKNLSPAALAQLEARYAGTRLGRQELYAEVLEDVEGALWTLTTLDSTRVELAPDMVRMVVSVDPSGGDAEGNDEQGIIVAGKGVDSHAYLLADRSCKLTPSGWASRAIAAYYEFRADRIVAERNFGGQMVASTIRSIEPNVKVVEVTASRGKRQRAEPVAALFEQGRAHIVGSMPQLEDQLTQWTPESGKSPDRLDAAVWAITDLMLGDPPPMFLGRY